MKWYCDECGSYRLDGEAIPCPDCCGYRITEPAASVEPRSCPDCKAAAVVPS